MTDITKLISFFGYCPVDSTSFRLNTREVNEQAVVRGYVVEKDACTSDVLTYLEDIDINPNSTFYQRWSDVISRSRFELFIDQILHYASTYGADFKGTPYVPNKNYGEKIDPQTEFSEYKVIKACTVKEMFSKCVDTLYSGIALKQDMMEAICNYIVDNFVDEDKTPICIDMITNREAQAFICSKLNILPVDRFTLLRHIIYETTGSTSVIKNSGTYNAIANSSHPFDFSTLNENRLMSLATIFYRFKDIFLAFKHNKISVSRGNSRIINKLRRMAVKYHTPFHARLWEHVLDEPRSLDELRLWEEDLSNYKIITLLQAIREKVSILTSEDHNALYIIRNGSVYMKEVNKMISKEMCEYYEKLFKYLYTTLVDRLKEKACIVKLPENYVLACPTSEKNFVGGLPIGTHFSLNESNFFGIYWKNEWGTRDFDLSFIDGSGCKVGWNSYFRDDENRVVFSGDMTSADPDASEVLYCKKVMPDGIIYVNRYSGNPGSKFRMYFGSENIDLDKFERGYMVDPASIQVNVDMTSNRREQMVGVVKGGEVYFMDLSIGDGMVSSFKDHHILDAIARRAGSAIEINQVLKDAGFIDASTLTDEELEGKEVLDLTTQNPSDIISLFS